MNKTDLCFLNKNNYWFLLILPNTINFVKEIMLVLESTYIENI